LDLKENCTNIIFSKHSVQQMFSRKIDKNNVTNSIETGEIIKEYGNEKPYPCYLILNFIDDKPVHIVIAVDL